MSIEDFALRFEGLDPVKVKAILDNTSHLLGVVESELPRIKQLIADVRTEIAAYEAKQKEFQR